jgi:inner membrane protein
MFYLDILQTKYQPLKCIEVFHTLLFLLVLIAPVLGWIAKKIHFKIKHVSFRDWTKIFFWTTVTHPLLDAHTTWGTQFFWPFDYRLAYQNIFVVDPSIYLTLSWIFNSSDEIKKRKPQEI